MPETSTPSIWLVAVAVIGLATIAVCEFVARYHDDSERVRSCVAACVGVTGHRVVSDDCECWAADARDGGVR